MENGYVLLTEREEMWAKMLVEVLRDNGVPCEALSVNGAGFAIKTGIQDTYKIYVDKDKLDEAKALYCELFGE